jgi:hypothetical protein
VVEKQFAERRSFTANYETPADTRSGDQTPIGGRG